MIHDLLPEQVAAVAIRGDDLTGVLYPEEAVELSRAVEKRVREFTSGRVCARRALNQLGLPDTPILRGPKGEPIWPLGVVGSITHCQGFRAAAVAFQQDLMTIGIDAEIHEPLPSGVRELVCVSQEIEWLASAPDGTCWDRLIFSAKESVYKAWFPLTRRWLGFEDAILTFDCGAGTFRGQLLVEPSGGAPSCFSGRFNVWNGFVLTAIAVPRPRTAQSPI